MAEDAKKQQGGKARRCTPEVHWGSAKRKCYTCVEYDTSSNGDYCDECFNVAHPWYRVKHNGFPLVKRGSSLSVGYEDDACGH